MRLGLRILNMDDQSAEGQRHATQVNRQAFVRAAQSERLVAVVLAIAEDRRSLPGNTEDEGDNPRVNRADSRSERGVARVRSGRRGRCRIAAVDRGVTARGV